MNVFTSVFLDNFFKKIKHKKSLDIITILLLVFLSLPTTVKSFYDLNIKTDKAIIDQEVVSGLRKISELTDPNSLILLYPSSDYPNSKTALKTNSALVPALTKRNVYFVDESQVGLFVDNPVEEKERILTIFSSDNEELIRNFIYNEKIDYVLLWKEENERVSTQFKNLLEPIFKNDTVLVFKIKI